ncbi:TSUP family transporter [Bradyrhizobium sp. LMG 9283]|uniref:TSUP family transporter n=1 Tax=Bradyrhizobium sp. LMG 9283 TaxID=592064 RepID=UPI00388D314C
MTIVSGFADISIFQLLLVALVALFASIIGGLAGYGTGALMPLVLVPLVGAEPVVPIIAISAMLTNASRALAYVRYADRRRALIVLACAALTTALGAYGYTRLTNAGAALVIGTMLILSVRCAACSAADSQDRQRRARRRLSWLWCAGRRHLGLRCDPALAPDGRRP